MHEIVCRRVEHNWVRRVQVNSWLECCLQMQGSRKSAVHMTTTTCAAHPAHPIYYSLTPVCPTNTTTIPNPPPPPQVTVHLPSVRCCSTLRPGPCCPPWWCCRHSPRTNNSRCGCGLCVCVGRGLVEGRGGGGCVEVWLISLARFGSAVFQTRTFVVS